MVKELTFEETKALLERDVLTLVEKVHALGRVDATSIEFYEALQEVRTATNHAETTYLAYTREEQVRLMYCQYCHHPRGYHSPERGCSMPLNRQGIPLGRREEQHSTCHCAFENAYPQDSTDSHG